MELSASDYQSLEGSALFSGLSLAQLSVPLRECTRVSVGAGGVLLSPGTDNTHIFILLDGALSVHLGERDAPAHTDLGPGDCVGEMSLVDGQPVCAWVLARRDTHLLAMPHATLWTLVEESHPIARNLLSILSGRVRSNNLSFVETRTQSLQFEQDSNVDRLTGLHNRRWLMATLPRVLQRCERDGQPVTLMLGDVDHFMHFAQQVASDVRDAALRRISDCLADGMRVQDMIAHLGEDRFVIALVRTEVDEALFIAERLRDMVATCGLSVGDSDEVLTISCGLAGHHAGESFESLLKRAETALAEAKDNGRDCVEAQP